MSMTKPTGVEGRASASRGRSMPRFLSIVVLTLGYWAFLSLSIPETNAGTSAAKPSIRISHLSRQSWYHFSNGNKKEGTKKLHEINSIISTNPELYTPNTKKAFSSLLNELSNSESRFSIKGYTPIIRDTLVSLDPIGAPEGKYNLPNYLTTFKLSPSATPAQSLAAIASRFDNIQTYAPVTATPAVRNFANDFRIGTLFPERWLREEQMSWQLKDAKTHNMISSWLATPKDKHVFVTGSSSDEKFVQTFREQAEADGYQLFFYKNCPPPLVIRQLVPSLPIRHVDSH